MRAVCVVALVLLLAGCADQAGNGFDVTGRPLPREEPDWPGPVQVEVGCRGIFVEAPQVTPIWARADWSPKELKACRSGVTHAVKEPYDDCNPKGWTLTNCVLPHERQFCHNGHWTTLCRDDGQCPDGMRCIWSEGAGPVPEGAYGWCAKTCQGDGTAADCLRCDLACDKELRVCVAKTPPAPEH